MTARVPFSIMSVAKPFVFALACAALGPDEVRARIGVNATGLPFNALSAVERSPDGRTNPMVNPGAIATTALVAGGDPVAERGSGSWPGCRRSRAGRSPSTKTSTSRRPPPTTATARSPSSCYARGALATYPDEAVELYTRQSCVAVTAEDLAVMGATLADGGVHPRTGERVVDLATCRATLTTMLVAGMYETSGDWLYDVGLPGKSGIGGGMVTVSPGKGALGTFSPPLDAAGNSVRGTRGAAFLSRTLGLDILASAPVRTTSQRDDHDPDDEEPEHQHGSRASSSRRSGSRPGP